MVTTVNGTCHHDCPDSCGWTATVADEVVVKLRGNPDHPYSQGELCPKVNRFLDRVYSPDRVLTPLRRIGPKGAGRFEPITWDVALDEIASRLNEVIERDGPEAVLPFSSAGNQSLLSLTGLSDRFFHHMGASRLIRGICGATAATGMAMTNGTGLCADPMTLDESNLILLWGTNTRLTNRHLWPVIERARARGARIIVIDPVRTITADAADLHIAPRPGSDVALMLAMMNVIIATDLVDHDWVDAHTVGFEELAHHVAGWTPEHAAEVCGLDAEVITSLATEYATTTPTAIRTLIGAEHRHDGAQFFRTLTCLPALVGSWRHRGGGLMRSVGAWQEQLIDEHAMSRPDLLGSRLPRQINMGTLGHALNTLEPPINALIVWNANPAVSIPNSAAIRTGLGRDDLFCVVHEQFITDTARFADIVLPATTQLETTDIVPAWGHLWMGWNEAAIEPLGESVSNTELFRRLATAMGYEEPSLYDDDDALMETALGPSLAEAGTTIAELRSAGWWKVPFPESPTPWTDGGFPTASGKVELASDRLEQLGVGRVPTVAEAERDDAYPLQLMTIKHHVRFHNSGYSHLPKHGNAEGSPFVSVHPDDANQRGIVDGAEVEVHNQRGRLRLVAHLEPTQQPGLVLIPWGWWSRHHVDGGVANDLTSDGSVTGAIGTAYFDTWVEVRPLDHDRSTADDEQVLGIS